jgi:erythromycin esterase
VRATGSYLADRFGDGYLAVGFAFGRGWFRASSDKTREKLAYPVKAVPAYTVDAALAAAGIPQLVLDLRELPERGPVRDWFAAPHPLRTYGAAHVADDYPWAPSHVLPKYDLLAFFSETKPTTLLPK